MSADEDHGDRLDVRTRRVYEPAERTDGARVLVDRLWPRGVSKAEAELDLWAKDAAPSADLRRAWHSDPEGHDPEHFAAFSRDYRKELAAEPASSAVDELARLAVERGRVTLLYGARDERVNHAVVLREAVLERARSR